MRFLHKYLPLLLVYLVGMQLYFCFWYLGSEGEALVWLYGSINFFHVWTSANMACLLLFLGLLYRLEMNKAKALHHGKVRELSFLFEWAIGGSVFPMLLLMNMGFILCDSWVFSYLKTPSFLSLIIYHITLFLVIISLSSLTERLGTFHKAIAYLFRVMSLPKQVEKGFMFLDLNASTSIAEQLGNESYSHFIRNCFRLLDEVVERYSGIEIYQYVGDEAVLHWDFSDRVANAQAIHLFREYKRLLQQRARHFKSNYGMQPTFKAALHGGMVMQSELGRKAIHVAFHGDVLNTTSRILSLCHEYQTDLLMSHDFYKTLNPMVMDRKYQMIERVELVGKAQHITLYKPIDSYARIHKTFFINQK